MSLRFGFIAGLAAMTACSGESDGKSVASLRHDLNGGRTLYAYPAEPAAEKRDEDKLHHKIYGPFGDTKSPRTPYICAWRSPNQFARDRSVAPTTVFLTCQFGTDDWEPPARLMEQVQARMQRDEGVVRIQWDRDSAGGYKLTRLEVEIRNLPAKLNFRSANFNPDEIAALQFRERAMTFPATLDDPFEFDFSATVPQRLNRGDTAVAPTARLTIRGTAVPMPPWVMY